MDPQPSNVERPPKPLKIKNYVAANPPGTTNYVRADEWVATTSAHHHRIFRWMPDESYKSFCDPFDTMEDQHVEDPGFYEN